MNLSEIDIDLYSSYYLTSFNEDFEVYEPAENGNKNLIDCDKFLTSSGILIAFKKTDKVQSVEYNYIAENSSGKEIIQCLCFEDFLFDINETESNNNSLYAITSTGVIEGQPKQDGISSHDDTERCDFGKLGARPLLSLRDNIGSKVFDHRDFAPDKISNLTCVLSFLNSGQILKFDFINERPDISGYPAFTAMSKTFLGILKTILEWNSVTEEPWNNDEEVASVCRGIVNNLDIPTDVINLINNTQVPMVVYRYLTDPDTSRQKFAENWEIDDLILTFLKTKVRYKTIGSLIKNCGRIFDINSNILSDEKEKIESQIFEFLSLSNLSMDEILSYSRKELQGIQNQTPNVDIESAIIKFKSLI